MNDTKRPNLPEESSDTDLDKLSDALMSRIIDGFASEADHRTFEQLADTTPHLWRELALRQRDAALLSSSVVTHLRQADRVDLPVEEHAIPFPAHATHPAGWLFASAGWAAAIAFAMLWWLAAPAGHAPPVNGHRHAVLTTTPEEQLRSYLQAPYVLGELDPVMAKVDELPDGRIAVVALRRIQEVIFLDEDDPLPVDEDRIFTMDPAELRLVRK